MSGNDENNSTMNNDLSKLNLSFYEKRIYLWRVKEKCRCKYFSTNLNFLLKSQLILRLKFILFFM